MEYLKLKNKLFFGTAEMLAQDGKLGEALFLLQGDIQDDYYDLVGLYFTDEEEYSRALFCPLPVVLHSKSAGAKRIREALQRIPKEHLVSRDWHDVYVRKFEVPSSYYPQKEEEVEEEEEDEVIE